MADDSLLEWLNDVVRKHGLTAQGGVATASADERSELEREYERLGGDDELYRVLAAEDKLFRGEVEKQRVTAQDWEKDRRRELEKRKRELEWRIDSTEKDSGAWQTWYDREKPLAEAIERRMRELGDKLGTEAGKELAYKVALFRRWIDDVPSRKEYDSKWLPRARAALEILEPRLREVAQTYEVIQQRIRDTLPELDNALEFRSLSLAERVERLRGGKRKTLGEAQKKLEAEIARIRKDSMAEDRRELVSYLPPLEGVELKPLKWKPIEAKLAELAKKSDAELKQSDAALAKAEEEYQEAGGDEALYQQRIKAWKETMATVRESDGDIAEAREKREAALQAAFVDAHRKLQESRNELTELRTKRERGKARLQERTRAAGEGDLMTSEESAELELLARELDRDAPAIASLEKLVPVLERSKENAELLLEKERKLLELKESDPGLIQARPMPESDELQGLPLRRKLEELKRGFS